MSIDKKTVDYVANLSRIELKESELEVLAGQLKGILDFIDKLSKLDVSKVEPTSHILPINTVLRSDSLKDSLSSDKALENAPRRSGEFFSVPKVIE